MYSFANVTFEKVMKQKIRNCEMNIASEEKRIAEFERKIEMKKSILKKAGMEGLDRSQVVKKILSAEDTNLYWYVCDIDNYEESIQNAYREIKRQKGLISKYKSLLIEKGNNL